KSIIHTTVMKMIKIVFTGMILLSSLSLFSQNWVDSVDVYGREVYMPAEKYKWDWGQATFMNSLIHLYNYKSPAEKVKYLQYIKTAMDATYNVANGKHPNAVASGHGMAFLARVTGDEKYLKKAIEIYNDYLQTPRAPNGGVSHRVETVELWDDTIYMISMFLLEMYRLTGDEKYIADFAAQVPAHREKLVDKQSELWVHGWDADNENYDDKCSILGWPDKVTQRSSQIWGRGNGWVTMALADALNTVPKTSVYWKPLEIEFKNILKSLPELQNKVSGHWYQLTVFPDDPSNFQESSSTAMFSYAIALGLKMKILDNETYMPVIDLSYRGLQQYSLKRTEAPYLIPVQVCGGTCVGDKSYYFNRPRTEGTGFGIGSFIMFGLEYEKFVYVIFLL
ncbi:MAG: glycoside hydrolase family 88 protein, partial [Bacteroidia bacterium]|nr:glycoside hydrolase family 88 protein [Bacteroidia bacterium]